MMCHTHFSLMLRDETGMCIERHISSYLCFETDDGPEAPQSDFVRLTVASQFSSISNRFRGLDIVQNVGKMRDQFDIFSEVNYLL